MCVALFSGAGLESSEELEEGWEYVKEVALAEDTPARLAFPCPPHRPTNTVLQREPVGVPAGTAAPAQMYDEIERPGKLFDEAVGAAEGVGGTAQRPNESALQISGQDRRSAVMLRWVARVSSAEDGAVGGMVGTVDGAARVRGGAGEAGSGGWTRRLAETAGTMTGAAVVVLAGGEHGADTRAQD